MNAPTRITASRAGYVSELTRAMKMLADSGYLFVGQCVAYDGQRSFPTFAEVPDAQKIEFPVAENLQLGYSLGLALTGQPVLSFFPRIDFLMSAMDQLVNHVDKAHEIFQCQPKLIIRTAVGAKSDVFSAGPQHTNDYFNELYSMCRNINLFRAMSDVDVQYWYKSAMKSDRPSLIVERQDCYD